MLYPPKFPGLGFFWYFIFFILSAIHPSVCYKSYAGGLTVASLWTPGTMLEAPWGTKENPALETWEGSVLMASEEGETGKNLFGKSLRLFVLLSSEDDLYMVVC